ncbi:hypothetical protein HAX54_024774 [Datura stramonium]|uniref:Uncharacterized protein n=1 Tax=Datura stramonium TaxID=4076 RepID=A0ABS8V0E8_DATST|nr:hypothetical protein [Datura stramonium]
MSSSKCLLVMSLGLIVLTTFSFADQHTKHGLNSATNQPNRKDYIAMEPAPKFEQERHDVQQLNDNSAKEPAPNFEQLEEDQKQHEYQELHYIPKKREEDESFKNEEGKGLCFVADCLGSLELKAPRWSSEEDKRQCGLKLKAAELKLMAASGVAPSPIIRFSVL